MAELFETTPQNITLHLWNIYNEKELEEKSTCKDFLQVEKEWIREVKRNTKMYSLEAIISVWYRVNSLKVTQFRIWATDKLKKNGLIFYNFYIMKWKVIKWHQVASWQAFNCPWIGWSVARQLPLMKKQWLDIFNLFAGTLNISLEYDKVVYPDFAEFDFIIDWRFPEKSTHFRLHKLIITYNWIDYEGWSYRKIYPDGYISIHPQPINVIEVLTQKIEWIYYDCPIEVKFCSI